MKLSVLANLYGTKSLEETLQILSGLGVHTVELGAGGYPGKAHCNPEELLSDEAKYEAFMATLKKYDMEVCALAAHGNALHPDAAIAAQFDKDFRNAVLLAEKMGVDTVITSSGCPGDHEGAKYPNWVTCPWPEDFLAILDWQWNEVLIPYWKKTVEFAKAHGVNKIAFELHPGFCVYNTHSLKKIREAVGPELGANFDPSHLAWQGMDPVKVINEIGDAIFHVHAKDARIDKYNTAVNGVLDTQSYGDIKNRSWLFRTVGYGNDESFWRDIVSALKTNGYDYAISIEHEDALMSKTEGLEKAAGFLKPLLIEETAGKMWWA